MHYKRRTRAPTISSSATSAIRSTRCGRRADKSAPTITAGTDPTSMYRRQRCYAKEQQQQRRHKRAAAYAVNPTIKPVNAPANATKGSKVMRPRQDVLSDLA